MHTHADMVVFPASVTEQLSHHHQEEDCSSGLQASPSCELIMPPQDMSAAGPGTVVLGLDLDGGKKLDLPSAAALQPEPAIVKKIAGKEGSLLLLPSCASQ